jgi:hypothetical protein
LVSFWALYSIILIHFIANTILEYWNLSLGWKNGLVYTNPSIWYITFNESG